MCVPVSPNPNEFSLFKSLSKYLSCLFPQITKSESSNANTNLEKEPEVNSSTADFNINNTYFKELNTDLLGEISKFTDEFSLIPHLRTTCRELKSSIPDFNQAQRDTYLRYKAYKENLNQILAIHESRDSYNVDQIISCFSHVIKDLQNLIQNTVLIQNISHTEYEQIKVAHNLMFYSIINSIMNTNKRLSNEIISKIKAMFSDIDEVQINEFFDAHAAYADNTTSSNFKALSIAYIDFIYCYFISTPVYIYVNSSSYINYIDIIIAKHKVCYDACNQHYQSTYTNFKNSINIVAKLLAIQKIFS